MSEVDKFECHACNHYFETSQTSGIVCPKCESPDDLEYLGYDVFDGDDNFMASFDAEGRPIE